MTMVVGMHLGDCVLIVADTRITYYPAGQEPRYEDGRPKIYRTKLGLMSGAGGVGLLDAVRIRLSGSDGNSLSTFNDIHRIIEEERALRAPAGDDSTIPEIHVSRANWLFSYWNPAPEPSQRLRMGVMAAGDPRSRILFRGDTHILFPTGTSEEAAAAITKTLDQHVRLSDAAATFADVLQHNIQLACEMIRHVGLQIPGVSPDSFQIGVYTSDLRWVISEIVDDSTGPFSLNLQPHDAPWPQVTPPPVVASIPPEALPALRAHLKASADLEVALTDFTATAADLVELVADEQEHESLTAVSHAMADAAAATTSFRDLVRTVNELGAPLVRDSADGQLDAVAIAAAIPAAAAGARATLPAFLRLAGALSAAGQIDYDVAPVRAALTALTPLIQAYSGSLHAFRRTEALAEPSGEG